MTPWIILFLGLVLASLESAQVEKNQSVTELEEFNIRANELAAGLDRRIVNISTLLEGVTGLFASSVEVSRDEFHQYIDHLDLEKKQTGIVAVGYLRNIQKNKTSEFEDALAHESMHHKVFPNPAQDTLAPVYYIEPQSKENLAIIGFDVLSEKTRADAAFRARDLGQTVMSDDLVLEQESRKKIRKPSFILFTPVYTKNAPLDTIAQRQKALEGWVSAGVRIDKLLEDYLKNVYPEFSQKIAVRFYSGHDLSDSELVYDGYLPGTRPVINNRMTYKATTLHLPWTLDIHLLPNQYTSPNQISTANLVFLLGVVLSILTSFLSYTLLQSHIRIRSALNEAKNANSLLAKQEALMRAIYDSSSVGVLLIHESGKIIYLNQQVAELFLKPFNQLLGANFYKIIPTDCVNTLHIEMLKLVERKYSTFVLEQSYLRHNNDLFIAQVTGRPFMDDLNHQNGIVLVIEDITERKVAQERINYLAHHDYLTDLPNRVLFVENAGKALALAKRNQRRMAILFIDLDRFKPINDEYGHEAGDVVLKTIAKRLKAMLRSSDTICRQGGDEFVILLPEYDDKESLEKLAVRIRNELNKPCTFGSFKLSVSGSIGIATYPENGDSVDAIIQSADTAMYRAKAEAEGIAFARYLSTIRNS